MRQHPKGRARMAKVAFELRADAEDFSGGTVSLPGGATLDVKEALDAGSGKIVLDPVPADKKGDDAQEKENWRAAEDGRKVEALDAFPALKRAQAGDATPASKPEKEGAS